MSGSRKAREFDPQVKRTDEEPTTQGPTLELLLVCWEPHGDDQWLLRSSSVFVTSQSFTTQKRAGNKKCSFATLEDYFLGVTQEAQEQYHWNSETVSA